MLFIIYKKRPLTNPQTPSKPKGGNILRNTSGRERKFDKRQHKY